MFKIELQQNQQLYFLADSHYNHKNIVRGTTEWKNLDENDNRVRNFDTIDQMNETLINNINSKIGQDDIIFHLGDWSFGGFEKIKEFRDRIVCQNIYLLIGNHDHHQEAQKEDCHLLFTQVFPSYLELEVKLFSTPKSTKTRHHFIMSHYPIASWHNMNKGWMHLHGHVHFPFNLKLGPGKMLDVGMDGNNYYPYSLDEIINLLKDRPNKSLFTFDHHNKEIR